MARTEEGEFVRKINLLKNPLAVLLLLFLAAGATEAQKRGGRHNARSKKAKTVEPTNDTPSAPPVTGSPADTVLDIGGDFLNSAARLLTDDPYAAFRGAQYTNAGLLNEADEARLGVMADKEVRKQFRPTQTGQARLERIGQRVAQASLRPDIKYRFFVVQDQAINALSLPGGYVYVTTALMNLANDDELASVVAHEVGHVTARHGLKSLQHAQQLSILAGLLGEVAGVAGGDARHLSAFAANLVGSGVLATHGREDEREADFLGVTVTTKAGFKPEAMITMFQKLQKMNDRQPDLLGAIFNDHPNVDERISNTAYEIKKMRDGE